MQHERSASTRIGQERALDVLLVSQAHFMERKYLNTPNVQHFANPPGKRVQGGSATVISRHETSGASFGQQDQVSRFGVEM